MTDNTKAPDIPHPSYPAGGYPSKGKKIGPAWAAMYATIRDAEDWTDGPGLARTLAPKYDLAPGTLIAIAARAVQAGIFERTWKPVAGDRGVRLRSHYKVVK